MLVLFFGSDGEQIAGVVRVSDAFAATHDKAIAALAQAKGFSVESRPDDYDQHPDLSQDDLGALANYLATLDDPS